MDDSFSRHNLEQNTIDRILDIIRARKKIATGYLVRKEVSRYKERPCYILGIIPEIARYSKISDEEMFEIADQVEDAVDIEKADI